MQTVYAVHRQDDDNNGVSSWVSKLFTEKQKAYEYMLQMWLDIVDWQWDWDDGDDIPWWYVHWKTPDQYTKKQIKELFWTYFEWDISDSRIYVNIRNEMYYHIFITELSLNE